MFKGFKNVASNPMFNGFPNLNFQMNNSAFGFSAAYHWLKASGGLNTQSNLGAVSSWVDSIAGLNWAQSTAGNQPRFIASDASFNNLPCVEFQDASRTLVLSSNTLEVPGAITIAIVAKIISIVSIKNILFTLNTSSTSSGILALNCNNASRGVGAYNSSVSILSNPTVNDLAAHIIVMTDKYVVVDGVLVATGSWSPGIAYNNLGIASATNGLASRIAESVFYKQSLSSADCIRLSTNINSKYAIY